MIVQRRCFILLSTLMMIVQLARAQTGWVQQGPAPTLHSMVFLDSLSAIALGERSGSWPTTGIIMRTVDGGITWGASECSLLQSIADASFCDSRTGIAVGERYVGGLSLVKIPSARKISNPDHFRYFEMCINPWG